MRFLKLRKILGVNMTTELNKLEENIDEDSLDNVDDVIEKIQDLSRREDLKHARTHELLETVLSRVMDIKERHEKTK